ncbi:hypothetical protein [Actinocatenispora rupis]|uniref:Uncharacterized protein n=1 Tax=Actinocatenispora rupis TaxID=519421 RepID=A0A8J3NC72_9ACTN|nr:hypothetical protein [Actinocatenispora rupis]GID14074.1 hypothetical protein Aru02nite_49630 [Actinocatenispora rupis]
MRVTVWSHTTEQRQTVPVTQVRPGDLVEVPIGWGDTLSARVAAVRTDGEYVSVWFPVSFGAGSAWRRLRRHRASTVAVTRTVTVTDTTGGQVA